MTAAQRDVVGIGNAIVDVLVETDDAFLAEQGLTKGAMRLIEADEAERLYEKLAAGHECSGGSAANTVVGVASLGGSAAYIGKVRDDLLGRVFRRDIRAAGVTFETPDATDGPATARCLVLVTPDAQRTMNTFLGASATLAPDDVDEAVVAGAAVTYLEGYLWDPPAAKQAFLRAAALAHGAGRQVALSLSDAFCVDRHREEFRELVRDHVDLVFANEDEVVSLYRARDFDEALSRLQEECETAAVTRGAKGSVVLVDGRRIDIEAEPVRRVVDTTGAGDLYAAGFLFGWTRGRDPRECAQIGGLAAAEVISHVGARPQADLRALLAARAR